MKRGFSAVTVVLLVLMAALLVYLFTYFLPAQQELNAMRAEISLHTAETAIYRQYIADTSPLEADIAAIQAEIDALHKDGYINDATVGMEINEAIQRYKISLKSIALGEVTSASGCRALPLHLSISGTYDSVLAFISHFENNSEGSYMVQAATMSVANNNCSASVVIYLCTPSV